MFERFTDGGRRVLMLAREEARLLNHDFIGTEHLLLGLICEDDGVAAHALRGLGIGAEPVREEVEERVGPSPSSTTGSPPLTARCKKVLELSIREALQLGHNYIGTEHLLLGLVREGEGLGAQVLVALGADLSAVRQAVLGQLDGRPSPGTVPAAGMRSVANPDGPRCPTCRSQLDGRVGYRVLAARPAGDPDTSEAIDVLFVYCLGCGVMLAHTAAREVGLTSETGVPGLEFAQVVWTAAEHQPERVIAEGVADDGVRWTLRAGGDDRSYATMLRTEDSAGVIDSGGMGGPKLWGTDRMSVYSGVNRDRGPRGLVVRCDPSIHHLSVVDDDGTDVAMVDCGEADGLRFGVLLVAPEARLREVVGTDGSGTVVDRCDLRGHDGRQRGSG